MKIPFVTFNRRIKEREGLYLAAIKEVLNSGNFLLGDGVKKLERNIERYLELKEKKVFAVSDGTRAIKIALQSLNLDKGDEIILPANTTSFCVAPLLGLGLTPVLADVDKNYVIDLDDIEKKITKKTRVIMPIHLYGRPCDMDKINELARKNELFILEDCSQSFGASYNGKKVGTFGDAAAISLYPTKNLAGMGDGGLVVVKESAADKIEKIRIGNQIQKDVFFEDFFPHSRMDDIFAAGVNINLNFVDEDNKRRRDLARLYCKGLGEVGDIVLPEDVEGHVYHLFVIRTKKRDELKAYLKDNGIDTGIHYPVPIHEQPYAAKHKLNSPSLVNSFNFSKEILSIPMYPELKGEEVEFIVSKIKTFFEN